MARPHAASRIEDTVHRRAERLLRGRGWENRTLPYTGYGNELFVRVLGRVLLGRQGDPLDEVLGPARCAKLPRLHGMDEAKRGWRVFITAPASGVPVEVRVGDRVVHTRTDRSGYVDVIVTDPALPAGWHNATITAAAAAPVDAPVQVTGASTRLGLVSDIDDTVMITKLPRVFIAAWNTFVRHEAARAVVPGMATLYRELLAEVPGAPIFYVSTGAWNTAPTLTRFLKRHGYPPGPMLLTDWGPTNTGWFRSGQDHKVAALHRLGREFPSVRWLLVGDDGQHDPKIYGDFARDRPDLVAAIAIRELSPAQQVLSHGIPVSNEELELLRPRRPREVITVRAPDGYGLARLLRAAQAW